MAFGVESNSKIPNRVLRSLNVELWVNGHDNDMYLYG